MHGEAVEEDDSAGFRIERVDRSAGELTAADAGAVKASVESLDDAVRCGAFGAAERVQPLVRVSAAAVGDQAEDLSPRVVAAAARRVDAAVRPDGRPLRGAASGPDELPIDLVLLAGERPRGQEKDRGEPRNLHGTVQSL
jgi:hypothetical protein